MKTTIKKEQNLVTLINVFKVEPENQKKLIDLLVNATENVMNKLPGFISANIHGSLDGKNVVNYAQWETKEHFENIFKNIEALKHMAIAEEIAIKIEPNLYSVNHIDHI
jgi:heme-degrading monooxygenase HmoA